VLVVSILVLLVLVNGVLFAQDAPEIEPWVCPEGFEGQQLSVYNWSTYVAEDTIANFEEACGVSVVYDVYESNEAMLARISQGNPGYDILVPTDYIVALMIAEGMLEPLNYANIPNLANVSENLLNPPYDPGNVYSIPYQWGTIGIGYDVEAVGFEITSWRQMFEYDGPVSWLEDVRPMFGVALSILGHDPNTADPDLIDEAKDYLIANGGNVVYINQDDGQEILLRGEAHIVVEYSGDLFQIMDECDCDRYAYVIPEEGANFWVDNLVIPTGASNPELAHVFLDYLMDPQVAADIANYTAYGSPNRAAIQAGLIDAELLDDPGIYPSAETEARLFRVVQDAELEQLYNDAWDEVKIFVGR
jgi:spermidine/putrescine transport system substrate-binding protein